MTRSACWFPSSRKLWAGIRSEFAPCSDRMASFCRSGRRFGQTRSPSAVQRQPVRRPSCKGSLCSITSVGWPPRSSPAPIRDPGCSSNPGCGGFNVDWIWQIRDSCGAGHRRECCSRGDGALLFVSVAGKQNDPDLRPKIPAAVVALCSVALCSASRVVSGRISCLSSPPFRPLGRLFYALGFAFAGLDPAALSPGLSFLPFRQHYLTYCFARRLTGSREVGALAMRAAGLSRQLGGARF